VSAYRGRQVATPIVQPGRYVPANIEMLPTLCTSQCCSLKLEDTTNRVWICRVEGGVTVERLIEGRWAVVSGGCYSKYAWVSRITEGK
jgi:hypothetical protein